MIRAIAILLALTPAFAAETARFESCYANWDGTKLVIGNSHIERQWQAEGGRLFATSFRDLDTKTEWLAARSQRPAPFPKFPAAEAQRKLTFSSRTGPATSVEAASLTVDLHSDTAPAVTYRFQVFPDARGAVILEKGRLHASVPDSPGFVWVRVKP